MKIQRRGYYLTKKGEVVHIWGLNPINDNGLAYGFFQNRKLGYERWERADGRVKGTSVGQNHEDQLIEFIGENLMESKRSPYGAK
jgi:hypothetical protein